MSVTLREGAFAKINLTLDVLGKRPDGYHDIQSVMQTISIRDDVEVEVGTAKPWTLSCDKEDVPQDSSNLAWKAAEMFCRAAKRDPEGVAIRITKRIPTQAGLGGGSADAAAVLRALNRHYDYPFSVYALAELGAEVGSDVPFCTWEARCCAKDGESGCGSCRICRRPCSWCANRTFLCQPLSCTGDWMRPPLPGGRITPPWRRPLSRGMWAP